LPSAKMFRDLNELQKGDQFFVQVLGETYAYEVEGIDVVEPHQTEWLEMEENKDQVTLLTCDPYMINTHRMLVTGERVPYEIEEASVNKTVSDKAEDLLIEHLYLTILLVIISITILIIFMVKYRKRNRE
ncbi:sortase, partial [Pontibacillus litoralis]